MKLDKLMNIINKVGNAIALNLLFLVSCLPVVTIGPAWCALMSAMRYEIRGDKWFAGFRAGFTTRFLRSMITGVLGNAAVLYLANNAYAGVKALMAGMGGIFSTVITCIFLLMAMLLMVSFLATNVYFGRDVDVWSDYAFMLLKKAPWQSFLCAVLMWAPVALVLWDFLLVVLFIMVFLVVYFVLTGLLMTGLLKNGLIAVLHKDRERFPEEDEE